MAIPALSLPLLTTAASLILFLPLDLLLSRRRRVAPATA